MDGNRFDDLTRGVANRRGLLKGLGGAAAGFAGLRISEALAACRPGNYACQRNSDCCSGVCYYPSKTARSRVCCTADPISVTCANNVCGTATNNCGATVTCGCGDLDCCGTTCVDTSSDSNNCGSCGNVCESGICENYECAAQPCETNDDCEFFCTCSNNHELNPEYGFCQGDYWVDFTNDLGDWQGDILLGNGVGVIDATDDGASTRFGGYSNLFPVNGWKNRLSVYLDMSLATGGGTDIRFDYSVAVSTPECGFRRDFIFAVGTDPSNAGKFLVSGSNNAPGWPGNPGRTPATISTSGWYTLAHSFDNGGGVLVVTMTLHDSSDTILGTWVLSDPTDVIGTTVGGHRYGWVFNNHFPNLQIDDSFLNYFPF